MLYSYCLITTLISLISVDKICDCFQNRLEKEGYEWVTVKNPNIRSRIYVLVCLAQILNICASVLILFNFDIFFIIAKNILVTKGKISKSIGEISSNNDEISHGENLNTYTESMEKTSSEKKDDKTTGIKEKLAQLKHERDMLLNQDGPIVEEDSIDGHVTYQKNNTPKV